MKASEMTNEELASEIEEAAKLYGECDDDGEREEHAILVEVARRLRNVTISSDNSAVIAELQRRLKVAEDALEELQDRFVSSVYDGTIDPYEALKIEEYALSAIRDGSSSKRNCDRFDDFSTAKHAWHEECFDYDESSGEWVNPKFPNLTFEEWLLAPCEEGGES